MNAIDFAKYQLGVGPERLNAVDVGLLISEFATPMLNPKMLCIAHVNQPMITAPTVGINHAPQADPAADYRLQRMFAGVRHDFRVYLAVALEHVERDGFLTSAANTLRAEVRFIYFNMPGDLRLLFAFLRQTAAST